MLVPDSLYFIFTFTDPSPALYFATKCWVACWVENIIGLHIQLTNKIAEKLSFIYHKVRFGIKESGGNTTCPVCGSLVVSDFIKRLLGLIRS